PSVTVLLLVAWLTVRWWTKRGSVPGPGRLPQGLGAGQRDAGDGLLVQPRQFRQPTRIFRPFALKAIQGRPLGRRQGRDEVLLDEILRHFRVVGRPGCPQRRRVCQARTLARRSERLREGRPAGYLLHPRQHLRLLQRLDRLHDVPRKVLPSRDGP